LATVPLSAQQSTTPGATPFEACQDYEIKTSVEELQDKGKKLRNALDRIYEELKGSAISVSAPMART
jgi:hypothetical protein